MFAGRDGFLSKAQSNPIFNGIRSSEICENDEVVMLDIPNGKVDHKFDPRKHRGKIMGAYAFVYRKGGEPTIEWAYIKDYDKGQFTWSTHKADMIKKVAETKALKKAFGISGIQSEYDFQVEGNAVIPVAELRTEQKDQLTDEQHKLWEETLLNIKDFQDPDELIKAKDSIIDELKKAGIGEDTLDEVLKVFQQKYDELSRVEI